MGAEREELAVTERTMRLCVFESVCCDRERDVVCESSSALCVGTFVGWVSVTVSCDTLSAFVRVSVVSGSLVNDKFNDFVRGSDKVRLKNGVLDAPLLDTVEERLVVPKDTVGFFDNESVSMLPVLFIDTVR